MPATASVTAEFPGAGAAAIRDLIETYAPTLTRLAAADPFDEVQRGISAFIRRLTEILQPEYRCYIGLVKLEAVGLAEDVRRRGGDPAFVTVLETMRDRLTELAHIEYRAQVDGQHVTRALRILAARNPAAHTALAAALATGHHSA